MITLYHYPKCSKSRACLQLLQEQNCAFQLIGYFKEGLKKEALLNLISMLSWDDLVRANEAIYKELNFQSLNQNQKIDAIINHPELLQRPLLIKGNKAIVARPPEKTLEFIHD
ncbi:MAG: arsenate reductase [Proteobacteria bacterium]|nr:arsenate reductase [Pseudomonadota bacterium]